MLLQVEEHNGHIFKSTQYSIPTYCEFCSSLIWMMDRACVCKRKSVTVDSRNHMSEFYQRCMSVSLWGENTVQMMFLELLTISLDHSGLHRATSDIPPFI